MSYEHLTKKVRRSCSVACGALFRKTNVLYDICLAYVDLDCYYRCFHTLFYLFLMCPKSRCYKREAEYIISRNLSSSPDSVRLHKWDEEDEI